MTRFVTWLRLNIDAVVAIVIAITAVIIEFIDKNTKLDPVSNARFEAGELDPYLPQIRQLELDDPL
ncbi:hypothetical protein [Nocardia tengchongensis]